MHHKNKIEEEALDTKQPGNLVVDGIVYPTFLGHGDVRRFHKRPIIDYLFRNSKNMNMDALWGLYESGMFEKHDFMQFYMDIGYSVCGFIEVWGDHAEIHEENTFSEEQIIY